jgi:hypothetical protein
MEKCEGGGCAYEGDLRAEGVTDTVTKSESFLLVGESPSEKKCKKVLKPFFSFHRDRYE